MAERKVVVMNYPFDRKEELVGALNYNYDTGMAQRNCKVVFAEDPNVALHQSSDAHIVVANTEMCGDFFVRLVKGKDYKGQHIVPFASSSSHRSKGVTGPDGKLIFPANYCGLSRMILEKLGQPLYKSNNRQESITMA